MQVPVTLSLVVPAFNEGSALRVNMENLLAALERAGVSYELIVVDNGSRDATPSALASLASAHPKVVPITLPINRGKGGGVLAGLAVARGSILGWADADGQGNPTDIPKLLALISAGNAFAKPVRVMRDETILRRVQSAIFNGLFRLLFGVSWRDINAAPKLMTREAYEKLQLTHKDWFLDAEALIKLKRMHLPVGEQEVAWQARKGGSSKIHALTSLEFLKNMVLYRLGVR